MAGSERHARCPGPVVVLPKRFVYVLRSQSDPTRYYTGITSNVAARLAAHNSGQCTHTADGRPWGIDPVVAFRDEAAP